MEGAHFIASDYKSLVKLSESQLNDCDTVSHGCQGGLEIFAFDYAMRNAMELEADYPYVPRDGACQYQASKGVVTALSHAAVKA